SRAIFFLDVGVILAALIAIVEDDADGGAVGLAVEDAGPDFGNVVFLPLRDDARLSRPSATQVRHQIFNTQSQARWTAVDNAKVTGPVADACGGHAKQLSECVARHRELHAERC